jgi:hypothetical protein
MAAPVRNILDTPSYVTYNIHRTLWEERAHWVRTKIAVNYLKVSNCKFLKWVESNYVNAGAVKEEQDRHKERKKVSK